MRRRGKCSQNHHSSLRWSSTKHSLISSFPHLPGKNTKTTTKPFVSSIWGRLHELKENYAGSGTWISFLHSFLSINTLAKTHTTQKAINRFLNTRTIWTDMAATAKEQTCSRQPPPTGFPKGKPWLVDWSKFDTQREIIILHHLASDLGFSNKRLQPHQPPDSVLVCVLQHSLHN